MFLLVKEEHHAHKRRRPSSTLNCRIIAADERLLRNMLRNTSRSLPTFKMHAFVEISVLATALEQCDSGGLGCSYRS
jgi:hypothetical protein